MAISTAPAAIVVAFPLDVTSPVKYALVVTVAASVALPAVRLAAGPVKFVATPLAGVPNAGVTNVGLVANTNAPLPVSSDIAVFNSNDVPVNVLSVRSIDLFEKVVV